jgi:hypothetical protein
LKGTAGAALLSSLVVFLLATTPATPPSEIKARRFVAVDPQGRSRAKLVVDEYGFARVAVTDTEGKSTADLTALPDGAVVLALRDKQGQGGIVAAVGKDGPSFRLSDDQGRTRAELSITAIPSTVALSLFSKEGNMRVVLTAQDDTWGLRLLDKDSPFRVRNALVHSVDGNSLLAFIGRDERARIFLSGTESSSSILIQDVGGRVVWRAP